jgi:hypothetical protein
MVHPESVENPGRKIFEIGPAPVCPDHEKSTGKKCRRRSYKKIDDRTLGLTGKKDGKVVPPSVYWSCATAEATDIKERQSAATAN